MGIKISASSSKNFAKIEEAINKFDNDFIKQFETAEYILDGYNNDIKLFSNRYYREKIELPNGFTFKGIKIDTNINYEKDSENNITEKEIYMINITGIYEGQGYSILFDGLMNKNLEINIKSR
ncbi:hypothetical protein [Anaerovorax sp. IOR16]|uniref:hypothetical protein n=1 Tax=Anaerovorax sp. IOR16 TaxID=2773458 RepID=UPI0019CFD8E3|nr:hypothetical protein [Anaerovorax sp. IOR16]